MSVHPNLPFHQPLRVLGSEGNWLLCIVVVVIIILLLAICTVVFIII